MIRSLSCLLALAGSLMAAGEDVSKLVDSPALPGVAIPPGTTLKIEADFAHQQLRSPTALTFDAQGRIYVTETDRFDFSVEGTLFGKRKEKLAPTANTEESELIRRLADTKGNGTLDESKFFAGGFKHRLDGPASAILAHEGVVYLGCIPNILMMRDAKGSGSVDERKTIVDDLGVYFSPHCQLGGFALGPDGRIYGTIGDCGIDLTTREGVRIHSLNQGAAFRFEVDGGGFEVFHTGLRNPKGVAFDSLGYPFAVDGGSGQGDEARIVYLVDGGDSGWEIEQKKQRMDSREADPTEVLPNRWMGEKMWQPANPEQPAYIVPAVANLAVEPGGITFHPGAGFLESEVGRFFICNYTGDPSTSGIRSFGIKPEGAGMKMTGVRNVLTGVAATDAKFSLDGRLFITDFCGGWNSHDDGRLLSLDVGTAAWRAKDAASTPRIMSEGMAQRSSAELINLFKHPDARVRLAAQLAITRKSDAIECLGKAALSSDLMVRLHGIWGLGVLDRKGSAPVPFSEFGVLPSESIHKAAEEKLLKLLKDPNEETRCQVLRVLSQAGPHAGLLELSTLLEDPSPRVRFFTAILIGKRKMTAYYGPVCDMLAANDNKDPYLRHAGAYALDQMFPDAEAIRIISKSDSPAARLGAVIALRRKQSPAVGDFLSDTDPKVLDEAIRAVCDLDLAAQRPAVAALFDELDAKKWPPVMLRRLLCNSYSIGDAENAARVLKFAADPKRPEALRKEAFRLLDQWVKPSAVDQFTGHDCPPEKRDPAEIAALLQKELPNLLHQEGIALAATRSLVERYHLDLTKLEVPFRR